VRARANVLHGTRLNEWVRRPFERALTRSPAASTLSRREREYHKNTTNGQEPQPYSFPSAIRFSRALSAVTFSGCLAARLVVSPMSASRSYSSSTFSRFVSRA